MGFENNAFMFHPTMKYNTAIQRYFYVFIKSSINPLFFINNTVKLLGFVDVEVTDLQEFH